MVYAHYEIERTLTDCKTLNSTVAAVEIGITLADMVANFALISFGNGCADLLASRRAGSLGKARTRILENSLGQLESRLAGGCVPCFCAWQSGGTVRRPCF